MVDVGGFDRVDLAEFEGRVDVGQLLDHGIDLLRRRGLLGDDGSVLIGRRTSGREQQAAQGEHRT
ncbi:hypothetical protein GCM10028833_30130 [Glycomyces tarimensis]